MIVTSNTTSATKKICVLVLGGTITMLPDKSGGVTPSLDGNALLKTFPQTDQTIELTVETPFLKPGASLTFDDISQVIDRLNGLTDAGYSGAVVVQGTDTIDETSFLLDLLFKKSMTIVVTGAMRAAGALSADGPANLAAAIRVAASDHAHGLGVLVVLDETIHFARDVQKGHTSLTSSFVSIPFGPAGYVVEGIVRIQKVKPAIQPPSLDIKKVSSVAIIKIAFDIDDLLLKCAHASGYKGLILEAMGGGHVPDRLLSTLTTIAAEIPVVLTTRVFSGPVLERTYSFPGSEMDLVQRGLIPAGHLTAPKARLLLGLLIGSGYDSRAISSTFASLR